MVRFGRVLALGAPKSWCLGPGWTSHCSVSLLKEHWAFWLGGPFSLGRTGSSLVSPQLFLHLDFCQMIITFRFFVKMLIALISGKKPFWLAGLHKLWYPGIRDTSTWSKFTANGEHGEVFLFSNLGALWFSENLIRHSLHICLREVKNNLFSFKHSYLRHFSWRF